MKEMRKQALPQRCWDPAVYSPSKCAAQNRLLITNNHVCGFLFSGWRWISTDSWGQREESSELKLKRHVFVDLDQNLSSKGCNLVLSFVFFYIFKGQKKCFSVEVKCWSRCSWSHRSIINCHCGWFTWDSMSLFLYLIISPRGPWGGLKWGSLFSQPSEGYSRISRTQVRAEGVDWPQPGSSSAQTHTNTHLYGVWLQPPHHHVKSPQSWCHIGGLKRDDPADKRQLKPSLCGCFCGLLLPSLACL